MPSIVLGAGVGVRSFRADGPTIVVGERPKLDPAHFSIAEFDRLEGRLQRPGRVWAVKTDARRHDIDCRALRSEELFVHASQGSARLAVWTNDIAVDEKAGHIYATSGGDLVRLSFAPDQEDTRVRGG